MDDHSFIEQTLELDAAERQALICAVERWNEYSASFYVDHYLAPVVAELVSRRLHNQGRSGGEGP